ncbi:sialic acid-binding Ig-like lectin 14 isoform 1-T2 [Clarias gariepinus]|uniref:sialic acid-binding Ig-like lectin 14 n=1 Tax=Clarias gariepinus TaxID=13013 RepID=UPI00234C7976|nr:sialic acid-binding Ig-like lectin 14 [Clarias gariepinus]XP_053344095.1 sialic acid-binding Ig-like lectin 14 [Clarias gariepinus]
MDKLSKRYFENRCLWTSLIISAFLSGGVLAGDWVVHVPVNPILAPQGSTVMLPCTYDFPDESGSRQVQSEMWCLNQSLCITPTYVYHSANIFPEPVFQGRVQYLGSLGSKNCSLRISDLRIKDSGVYVFRFITNHPVSKLPEQRGVMLRVTAKGSSSAATVGIVLGVLLLLTVMVTIFACSKRHAASKSLQPVLNDECNL